MNSELRDKIFCAIDDPRYLTVEQASEITDNVMAVLENYPIGLAAGAIYALGIVASQHASNVEIRDAMREMDFLPDGNDNGGSYGSPWTRDQLIAAGADIYDAEQVIACLECREPEEV